MKGRVWKVTVPLEDFYYFGLIAIAQKLKKEGKLKRFKGVQQLLPETQLRLLLILT